VTAGTVGALLLAGGLQLPAGCVTPTMRTLDQVAPQIDVTIADRGVDGIHLTGTGHLSALDAVLEINTSDGAFARPMGGTAIDKQGARNGLGPVLTAAQIAAATNPFANVAH
jgi:hypothetical protein